MAKQIDSLTADQADALDGLVRAVEAEQQAVAHHAARGAEAAVRLAAAKATLDAALRAVGMGALDAGDVSATRDENTGKLVEIRSDDATKP